MLTARIMRVLLFCLLTLPSVSGCFLDLFGICGGAAKIADELDKLPAKVEEAAEQIFDQLFNKDLPPFVDKITAAAEEMLDRGEQDYEKAVDATRDALTALARAVVNDCEELAKDITKDVEEIVTTVLNKTVEAVKQITDDISKAVNQLIDRLEIIGKTLFCSASGYIDIFEKQFASFFEKQDCECVQQMLAANPGLKEDCECTSCFHVGGWYPKCKCNPWGIKFGPGWYNRGKYQFAKCHLYKPINWEQWTVQQIENQLSIVQSMALSFRCLEDVQPGSTVNRDFFSNEFVNISHTILVLKNAEQHRKRLPTQLGQHHNHKILQLLAATNSCADKTLPECVTQALEELETMRQQMQQQSAAISKNTHAVSQVKSVISDVDGLKDAVSQVKSDVTDLGDKVTQVQSDVGGLSVGLCECQNYDHTYLVPQGFVTQGYPARCENACDSGFAPPGSTADKPYVIICKPCLNGDGSDALLEQGRMESCTPSKKPCSPSQEQSIVVA